LGEAAGVAEEAATQAEAVLAGLEAATSAVVGPAEAGENGRQGNEAVGNRDWGVKARNWDVGTSK